MSVVQILVSTFGLSHPYLELACVVMRPADRSCRGREVSSQGGAGLANDQKQRLAELSGLRDTTCTHISHDSILASVSLLELKNLGGLAGTTSADRSQI